LLSELFIGGEWRKPADPREIEVHNPATEEVILRVAAGGPKDVDRAVHAAQAALQGWRALGGRARAGFLRAIAERLRNRAEDLARLSSINNGKPLPESLVDVGRRDIVRILCGEGDRA
jgi:betaine-aldehyde dehydrogenase